MICLTSGGELGLPLVFPLCPHKMKKAQPCSFLWLPLCRASPVWSLQLSQSSPLQGGGCKRELLLEVRVTVWTWVGGHSLLSGESACLPQMPHPGAAQKDSWAAASHTEPGANWAPRASGRGAGPRGGTSPLATCPQPACLTYWCCHLAFNPAIFSGTR